MLRSLIRKGTVAGGDFMSPATTGLAIAAFSMMFLVACATSPLGRQQLQLFSDEMMADMGRTAFDNLLSEEKLARDRAVTRYVNCVADRIIAALPPEQQSGWDVRVLADDQLNAFALPGRKIGVYQGLLKAARNQHQLATVIGHEVAHVLAEHGNERLSTSYAAEAGLQLVGGLIGDPGSSQSRTVMALLGLGTQVGVLLPFSRTQEAEADLLGLDLMADAGFDPGASIELWQNMAAESKGTPPEFLSTHPGPDSRMRSLQKRMPMAEARLEAALRRGNRPDCRPER